LSCGRIETDGMRYIDGEMTPDERSGFEEHLAGCETCREAMEELSVVNRLTGMMRIRDPVDDFWENYWKSIMRRAERRFAWILLVTGAVLAAIWQLYRAVRDFGRLTFGKAALLIFAAGAVMLLVSVVRERIHQHRTDKYRDIKR